MIAIRITNIGISSSSKYSISSLHSFLLNSSVLLNCFQCLILLNITILLNISIFHNTRQNIRKVIQKVDTYTVISNQNLVKIRLCKNKAWILTNFFSCFDFMNDQSFIKWAAIGNRRWRSVMWSEYSVKKESISFISDPTQHRVKL